MSELQRLQKSHDVVSRGDKAIIFANGWRGGAGKSALTIGLVRLYTDEQPEPVPVMTLPFEAQLHHQRRQFSVHLSPRQRNRWRPAGRGIK